jgi:hypothetical protein
MLAGLWCAIQHWGHNATGFDMGILTIILFLPETKGLSLEKIDILFSIKGLAY